MSFHTLEGRGYNALACGPDIHIPARTNKNIIDIEFWLYLQILNCYVDKIPDNKVSYLKTSIRNICDRSNFIRVTLKFRKIV